MKASLLVVSDFRNLMGCFAVGSLVVLPIWLFALHHDFVTRLSIPLLVQHSVSFTLIIGRSLCLFVEVCFSFLPAVSSLFISSLILTVFFLLSDFAVGKSFWRSKIVLVNFPLNMRLFSLNNRLFICLIC